MKNFGFSACFNFFKLTNSIQNWSKISNKNKQGRGLEKNGRHLETGKSDIV